mmetsp:Transcript_3346/g.8580  ORF Transcript_3346/g.8580 Transcript_3346/m.8580 type:complete len:590 (-) Transcript_3346:19-1788(-)
MIEYDETDWFAKLLFQVKGSVIPRSLCFAIPAACMAVVLVYVEQVFQGYAEASGINDVGSSQTYAATTGVIAIMLGFRAKQALGRFWEGTSLLHQMRGEWFDSVSCLVTFTRGAMDTKPEAVREFRHTLVRLMSLCHGSALEEIKDNESEYFEVIDITGLDEEVLEYIDECKTEHGFNRVEVVLHMIQVLITKNLDDGVLKIAPPILSRVYQTLSRGLVNLLNATKIKNTKFPFPYAQLMASLLVLHTLWTPFMVTAYVKTAWMAGLISFLPVFGMFCVNFTSIELEMPFGNDENDLPLGTFQHDMNRGLMMLLHHKTDMVARTSPLCMYDFDSIERNGFSAVFEDGDIQSSSSRVRSTPSTPTSKRPSATSSVSASKSLFRCALEEVQSKTTGSIELSGGLCSSARVTSVSFAVPPSASPPLVPPSAGTPEAQRKSEVAAHLAPAPSQKFSAQAAVANPGVLCTFSDTEETLDKALGTWAQNADAHVAALRENTAAISEFVANFPKMLSAAQVETPSIGIWGCWTGAAGGRRIAAMPPQYAVPPEPRHPVQPDFGAVMAAAQAAAELAAAEDAPSMDDSYADFEGGRR